MTEPNETGTKVLSGAELIAAERQRQMDVEGWTPEHDDRHDDLELIAGADAYMVAAGARLVHDSPIELMAEVPPPSWPWAASWWKPSDDPVRMLVKAGALIAAEIDRIQRRDDG
jgi:hypothetical protein